MHRSNRHDVFADLIRDITRREKIRKALAVNATAADTLRFAARTDGTLEEEEEEDDAQSTQDDEGDDGNDDAIAEGTTTTTTTATATTTKRAQMPRTFRPALGVTVALAEVQRLLPNTPDIPFTIPVRFADRLGVFLSDGVPFPTGQFPQPEGGLITVFPFADMEPEDPLLLRFRVHARALFHGVPKYSFVEATAGEELWYGRVWLLFQCRFRDKVYNLALVSWLQLRAGAPFGTQKPTFSWSSPFLDCIEVEHLRRTLIVVPSMLPRARGLGQILHLLS